MRRSARPARLTLFSILVPGLLAVPVLTPPSPSPRPVAPEVVEVALDGVALPRAGAGLRREEPAPGAGRTVVLTAQRDTRPFSLVGVTWDRPAPGAGPVGPLDVQVRTRTGGHWSAWEALDAAPELPDATTDEARTARPGTEPLWVGDADGVQVRVGVLSGAAPTGLRLSLVDPGESPADAGAAAPAAAASTATAAARVPLIRPRSAWGADESIRRGSPSYAAVRAVTLHHTASSSSYSAADVPGILRGFYAYHVKSNGWSDIGYNFLVDRFGTIWEGRHGGMNRGVIGSHAGGFNTGTVGVSMIGTYETVAPSPAMRESVAQVAAWKMSAAGINPRGSLSFTSLGSTRFARGKVVTLPTLFAHKQVSTTACPGTKGTAAMPGLRDRIASLMGGATPWLPAPEPAAPPATQEVPLPAGTPVVTVPATAQAGSSVEVVVRGTAGAPVELWIAKGVGSGATRRRDARFGEDGTYTTTFTADADYLLFAVSAGKASPRVETRVTPARADAPSAPTSLGIAGPVTAGEGETVPVVVTGPPGTAITVWFRAHGDPVFTSRRSGRLGDDGTFVTSYVGGRAHDFFAMAGTVTSPDATTLAGAVPNGLDITAPDDAPVGRTVDVVVQGKPGAAVEVWFARRGEAAFNRRREAVLGLTGTYRTSFVATDEHTYYAVSGGRTSTRVVTKVTGTPLDTAPPAQPRLAVEAPPAVDAGSPVALTVRGTAGAPVEVWFRRRGSEVWSRLRSGRFDASGAYTTSYAGTEDHEYYATSGSVSSPDGETGTVPVLNGPPSVRLGTTVRLTGRARPNDKVIVEQRRAGASAFSRRTVASGATGAFATTYAADNEYEYRALSGTLTGALHRTRVAPTATGPRYAGRGSTVVLTGTARPGGKVEVLFRAKGQRYFTVGRVIAADSAGRWRTSFGLKVDHVWYARSDGNASATGSTHVR